MSIVQNKISKRKQRNLRNVLVLPEKTSWPSPSDSDSVIIKNKLKECLVPVRINIPRAPGHMVRSLSKEERRKKHKEFLHAQTPEQINAYYKALELRKFLFLGVNSVCKGIEDKNIASCIFDADVSPKILVSHIADLARNASIPVLAIRNLKETLNSVLGFSSIAIGFQKSVKNDNSNIFYGTCSSIIDMAEFISKSKDQNVNNLESKQADVTNENCKQNVNNDELKKNASVSVFSYKISIAEELKSVYLYRSSEEVRVFKPPVADVTTSTTASNETIFIDKVQVPPSKDLDKTLRYYTPLVHRIQNNPLKKKKIKSKKKMAAGNSSKQA